MSKKIRIGCASAFYGDSQLSARQLVDKGDIDYLVFDYLAEVTMALLARAKAKNENLGFAVDFVSVAMNDVLADCAKKGIKVIANAGGVNVPACISALEQLCDSQGLNLKIAGVYGDDLSENINELSKNNDLSEIQTGQALPEKLASVNAYLGGRPVADALAAGADVVVTGRVVDSAVVIGPLMHEFGWQDDQFDHIAQAALAGHVIECGAQCTGGNFTDWQLVPDFSNMSYPIAEVSEDGSFIVDIPPETGGLVNIGTVSEQIVYEIGDPANYLLPDVACDFSQVSLNEIGKNRVKVSGAKGRSPGNKYKLCATYVDGYMLTGTFFMAGLRCADKARASLNAWVKRTEKEFTTKDLGCYRDVSIEIIGAEDTYGPHALTQDTREVMGKYGVHHNNKKALQFAAMELAYLATSASPGMSGFGAGRNRPSPLMRVHSALIDKSLVSVIVQVGSEVIVNRPFTCPVESISKPKSQYPEFISGEQFEDSNDLVEVSLEQLVYARSGDKGNNANIGVVARKSSYLPALYQQLTAESVAKYFEHLVEGEVERFALPGFNAFNFFMTEALGGGGAASLRVDSQAKAFAQMLLSKKITISAQLLES
ncbi:MAG: DUF1446 domain-containing protein [Alteromonadales bacterium]|nr:DUF1446 domain-containing protein [Alteromonadales bacterium]